MKNKSILLELIIRQIQHSFPVVNKNWNCFFEENEARRIQFYNHSYIITMQTWLDHRNMFFFIYSYCSLRLLLKNTQKMKKLFLTRKMIEFCLIAIFIDFFHGISYEECWSCSYLIYRKWIVVEWLKMHTYTLNEK